MFHNYYCDKKWKESCLRENLPNISLILWTWITHVSFLVAQKNTSLSFWIKTISSWSIFIFHEWIKKIWWRKTGRKGKKRNREFDCANKIAFHPGESSFITSWWCCTSDLDQPSGRQLWAGLTLKSQTLATPSRRCPIWHGQTACVCYTFTSHWKWCWLPMC